MAKATSPTLVADEVIIIKFILSECRKLDKDLAELYDVTTGNLNKAVKRNPKRFPLILCLPLPKKNLKT